MSLPFLIDLIIEVSMWGSLSFISIIVTNKTTNAKSFSAWYLLKFVNR